jgi:phosphatidylglycerophosphatase A
VTALAAPPQDDPKHAVSRPFLARARELFATFFYVGYLPLVPGTWGSAAAAAAFVAAGRPFGPAGWTAFGGVILVSCFALSRAERVFGAHDPKPVVLDEVAGMWLTFMLGNAGGWGYLAAGFALFRALDGLKPWPIRYLERLPGGVGIIADDLGAGLVAGLVVRAATALLAH